MHVEQDWSDFDGLMVRMYKFANEKSPSIAADIVKRQIIDNTAAGVDANKKTFVPYSERHKRTRLKHNLPWRPVDLRFSGLMLDGVKFEGDALGVVGDHGQLADYHNDGMGNLPQRKFFAVGDDSLPKIEEKIADGINAL